MNNVPGRVAIRGSQIFFGGGPNISLVSLSWWCTSVWWSSEYLGQQDGAFGFELK